MLNSTVGRCITFSLMLLCFLCAAIGSVQWQRRAYHIDCVKVPAAILAVVFVSILLLCAVLPWLTVKVGMATNTLGLDWKPYLICYRIAYFAAFPALVFLTIGYGRLEFFGTAEGDPRQVSVSKLTKDSGHYFESSDGFVALNLTRGIVETLHVAEHGEPDMRRISRFQNAQLRVNKEPFMNLPEPTVPPGRVATYVIAPVFVTWERCASQYRISSQCLQRNQVAGWAVAQTHSLCTSLRMLGCKPQEPQLQPVYRCSTSAVYGSDVVGPISQLCGRVIYPPPFGVIDELKVLLVEAGWPTEFLPNTSHVWLDVASDVCIGNPAVCKQSWQRIGNIGAALSALTVLCFLIPATLDCIIDHRIRRALTYFENSQKQLR